MLNKSGRGRRAGSPDTRAHVLDVARRRFLAEGYQGVTLRSIAAEAGVDVALISYFFGSKRGLFAAVLALPANPPDLLRAALPGDLATLPERVLRTLLATWDDPDRGAQLRVTVAASIQEPELRRLLTEVLEREVISVLAEHLGGADAIERAAAFATQIAGLVFTRYILELEPIASLPADELIRRLAPGLRTMLRPQPAARPAVTPPSGSSPRRRSRPPPSRRNRDDKSSRAVTVPNWRAYLQRILLCENVARRREPTVETLSLAVADSPYSWMRAALMCRP